MYSLQQLPIYDSLCSPSVYACRVYGRLFVFIRNLNIHLSVFAKSAIFRSIAKIIMTAVEAYNICSSECIRILRSVNVAIDRDY